STKTKLSLCALVSGGLDSDVLLARLSLRNKKVIPIYIKQGLVWEDAELYWLQRYLRMLRTKALFRNIEPLRIFSMPMGDVYGEHWSTGKGRVPGYSSADEAV